MLSQILVLVILILLNAFFAASEMAFISLNDAKISKQAKQGNKKAKQIQKMLDNPISALTTICFSTEKSFIMSKYQSTNMN